MMRKLLSAALAAVLFLAPVAASAADCSGTTGAGATTIINGTNVRALEIMNNSTSLMCIAFNGAAAATGGVNCAQGSFPLQPGSATTAGGSYSKPEMQNVSFLSIVSAGGAGGIFSCNFTR